MNDGAKNRESVSQPNPPNESFSVSNYIDSKLDRTQWLTSEQFHSLHENARNKYDAESAQVLKTVITHFIEHPEDLLKLPQEIPDNPFGYTFKDASRIDKLKFCYLPRKKEDAFCRTILELIGRMDLSLTTIKKALYLTDPTQYSDIWKHMKDGNVNLFPVGIFNILRENYLLQVITEPIIESCKLYIKEQLPFPQLKIPVMLDFYNSHRTSIQPFVRQDSQLFHHLFLILDSELVESILKSGGKIENLPADKVAKLTKTVFSDFIHEYAHALFAELCLDDEFMEDTLSRNNNSHSQPTLLQVLDEAFAMFISRSAEIQLLKESKGSDTALFSATRNSLLGNTTSDLANYLKRYSPVHYIGYYRVARKLKHLTAEQVISLLPLINVRKCAQIKANSAEFDNILEDPLNRVPKRITA